MKHTSREQASVENIYRLEGRVPVGKAIPFGLQHFKLAKLALLPFGAEIVNKE